MRGKKLTIHIWLVRHMVTKSKAIKNQAVVEPIMPVVIILMNNHLSINKKLELIFFIVINNKLFQYLI